MRRASLIATCVALAGSGASACAAIVGADFDRSGASDDGGGASDAASGPPATNGDATTTETSGDDASDDATIHVADGATPGDDDDDADSGSDAAGRGDSGGGTSDAGQLDGGSDAATFVVCGDTRGLQPGSPWPMAGGCPSRAYHTSAPSLSAPHIAWRYDIQSAASAQFTTAPVIAADGTVYVVGHAALGDASVASYVLFAIRDGSLVFATPLDGIASAPVIAANGDLYLHELSTLLVIDPASGSITDRYPLTGFSDDSPTILGDGTVVVLDGGRMVFVAHSAIATTFTLPTGPAESFVGSDVTVSSEGVIYAVARRSGQAAQLLYGINESGQIVTGPVTLSGDSNEFAQMDNAGNIFVGGDGVLETYFPNGTRSSTKTFTDTISLQHAAYSGTQLWLTTDSKGPLRFTEASSLYKYFSAEAEPLSSFTVTGDSSVVFCAGGSSGASSNVVQSWSPSGTVRWSVALDAIAAEPYGVSIDAAGVVYVPYGPTLYAISD